MKKQFDRYAKTARREETWGQDSNYLYFKKWEKGDIKRIYINDYKKRTLGYIEDGKVIINDRQGISQEDIDMAVNNFKNEYEF